MRLFLRICCLIIVMYYLIFLNYEAVYEAEVFDNYKELAYDSVGYRFIKWNFDHLLFLSSISALISIALARNLNRNWLGWGIFSFLMPFLSCLILAFLRESDGVSYSSSSGGSYSGNSYGYGSYNEYLVGKTCGNCGKSVSLSSHSGGRCPHCGAYWGSEHKTYIH